jgi:hypothetical protein
MTGATRRLVLHVTMLVLIIGGWLVARLVAQAPTPAPAEAPSLFAQWLTPQAVLGVALIVLYAGELRGDVRRLKDDLAAIQTRLHDDYMTTREVEARLGDGGRRSGDR